MISLSFPSPAPVEVAAPHLVRRVGCMGPECFGGRKATACLDSSSQRLGWGSYIGWGQSWFWGASRELPRPYEMEAGSLHRSRLGCLSERQAVEVGTKCWTVGLPAVRFWGIERELWGFVSRKER